MGGRKDDVMTRPKNRNRPLSAVIEEFEVDDPDLKNLLSKNSHDENDNDDDERGGGGGGGGRGGGGERERGGGSGRGKGKSVNGINNDKNIRGKDNNSSSVGNVSVSERTSRTKNDKLPSSSSFSSSSLLSGRVHLSPTTEESSSITSVCFKDTRLSNVESKVKELIKTKPSSSSELCGVKSPLSSSSSSSLSYLFSRSLAAIPPPPSSQLASASTRRSLEAVVSPPSSQLASASTRRSLEAVVSPSSSAARRSLEAVASPPSSLPASTGRSLEAVASPPPSPLASALTPRSLEVVTSPPSSPLASLSRQRSLEAVTSPPPSTLSTPSSPLSPSSLSSSSTPTNSPTALNPAHFHLNFHYANCSTPLTSSAGVPPFSPASLPTSPLSPTSAMSLGSPCTPSTPSSPSSSGGTPSPSTTGGNAFKIPIVSVTVCDLGGEFRERTSSNASDASVNSENGGYSGYNNLNNNTSGSSAGSSPRRPSLRSRRSALTPNNINTLLTPSPKLGRRGSFGRRSFGSDGTQDGDDDTMSTSEHMARLRQMTERLSLSTRRPSTMQWRAQYIERPAFPEQRVRTRKNGSDVMDVDDDVEGVEEEEENGGGREGGGKWTVERTQRINTALDWIKNELLEMRAQDQNLARQLLSIRSDIHQLKLARSCEEHQEMLDDVQSELEELQEFADVLDLPTPTITDSPLKHLGVTRMNFSARRFSTC